MTRNNLIVLFWVFVIGGLLWQFHDYDQNSREKEKQRVAALTRPEGHYFSYDTNGVRPAAPPGPKQGPDPRRTGYRVEDNYPYVGMFTVHVTLQNFGLSTARAIQVSIRPYRSAAEVNEDAGMAAPRLPGGDGPRPYADPLAQAEKWVSVPDLKPGESAEVTASFPDLPSIQKADSPPMDIHYAP